MKKLLEKDKNIRRNLKLVEKKHFILKNIFRNYNFSLLIRWNAFLKLKTFTKNNSKVSTVNRCLQSVHKKRFNKLTTFSRHIFLKLVREGAISGVQKSSW